MPISSLAVPRAQASCSTLSRPDGLMARRRYSNQVLHSKCNLGRIFIRTARSGVNSTTCGVAGADEGTSSRVSTSRVEGAVDNEAANNVEPNPSVVSAIRSVSTTRSVSTIRSVSRDGTIIIGKEISSKGCC
eukprot:gene23747-9305_t